jgi:hypothetical protein
MRDDADVIPHALDPTQPPTPQLVYSVGRPRGDDALPDDVADLADPEQRLVRILESGQRRAFPVHGTGDTAVIGFSDGA